MLRRITLLLILVLMFAGAVSTSMTNAAAEGQNEQGPKLESVGP